MSPPRVAHLSIGDELLTGRHPDLDAPHVARWLGERGFALGEVRVLPDDEALIVAALEELMARNDLVVTSGGLGPTLDDLSRHAVARAAGCELEEREEAWEQIAAWFRVRGIEPPANNRRQALIPAGARILENRHGTAPGFWLDVEGARHTVSIVALPGPPRELTGMLADGALAEFAERFGGPDQRVRQELSLFGLSESVFAERVSDWMARDVDPTMGVSARDGILVVALSSSGPGARKRVDEALVAFHDRLGEYVFAEGDRRLDAVLAEALLASGTKIALAESCTGGRIAAALTRHAGVSAVFGEGAVTYANEAKHRTLDVPSAMLEAHGAVSPETAAAMARGIAERAGADLGLSVTGIAGPGGGSEDKPVGLVWFGVHWRGRTWVCERRFPPTDRERVRRFAEHTALHLGLCALSDRLESVGAVEV